ncbi:hypothetical protein BDW42DRAFT_157836 [Aspergillus taichungensis]|uniref:Uncharacterized protein n=1 Tax=Aspergillus taichungensis TaxID=482145 RepID=A0A2J5I9S6_9EURO|nr:hypothetical protein BDW42DRAFT_157836 [Aspergillus taichungensis]
MHRHAFGLSRSRPSCTVHNLRVNARGPDPTSTLDTVHRLGSLYYYHGILVDEMYQRVPAGKEKDPLAQIPVGHGGIKRLNRPSITGNTAHYILWNILR